jgi:hypothetical protein
MVTPSVSSTRVTVKVGDRDVGDRWRSGRVGDGHRGGALVVGRVVVGEVMAGGQRVIANRAAGGGPAERDGRTEPGGEPTHALGADGAAVGGVHQSDEERPGVLIAQVLDGDVDPGGIALQHRGHRADTGDAEVGDRVGPAG